MRRILALALVFAATCHAAEGQTGGKRPAGNERVAEEIKRLDRQWLVESYDSANDLSAFDRIVADDFLITHSRGRVLDKAQKRADILSNHAPPSAPRPAPAPGAAFRIEDSSTLVRVYGGVAVSTGYIVERDPSQGRDDRVYFTNTYLKRKGRWQVVASQLTRVPQRPR